MQSMSDDELEAALRAARPRPRPDLAARVLAIALEERPHARRWRTPAAIGVGVMALAAAAAVLLVVRAPRRFPGVVVVPPKSPSVERPAGKLPATSLHDSIIDKLNHEEPGGEERLAMVRKALPTLHEECLAHAFEGKPPVTHVVTAHMTILAIHFTGSLDDPTGNVSRVWVVPSNVLSDKVELCIEHFFQQMRLPLPGDATTHLTVPLDVTPHPAEDARLDRAYRDYIDGNYVEARELARSVPRGHKAWRIIGASSCVLGDRDAAVEAARNVPWTDSFMDLMCKRNHIELPDDEDNPLRFIPHGAR